MMVEAKVIRGRWWTGRMAGQSGKVGRSSGVACLVSSIPRDVRSSAQASMG